MLLAEDAMSASGSSSGPSASWSDDAAEAERAQRAVLASLRLQLRTAEREAEAAESGQLGLDAEQRRALLTQSVESWLDGRRRQMELELARARADAARRVEAARHLAAARSGRPPRPSMSMPSPSPGGAPRYPSPLAADGSHELDAPLNLVRQRRHLPPRPTSRLAPLSLDLPPAPSLEPLTYPEPARWFIDEPAPVAPRPAPVVPPAAERPSAEPATAPTWPPAPGSPEADLGPAPAVDAPAPVDDAPAPVDEPTIQRPPALEPVVTHPRPQPAPAPASAAASGTPMVIVPPPGYGYQLISLDAQTPVPVQVPMPVAGWAPQVWGPVGPAPAGPVAAEADETSLRDFIRRLKHPDVALPLIAALLLLVVLVAWVG
jgi:hypothetical protein